MQAVSLYDYFGPGESNGGVEVPDFRAILKSCIRYCRLCFGRCFALNCYTKSGVMMSFVFT